MFNDHESHFLLVSCNEWDVYFEVKVELEGGLIRDPVL